MGRSEICVPSSTYTQGSEGSVTTTATQAAMLLILVSLLRIVRAEKHNRARTCTATSVTQGRSAARTHVTKHKVFKQQRRVASAYTKASARLCRACCCDPFFLSIAYLVVHLPDLFSITPQLRCDLHRCSGGGKHRNARRRRTTCSVRQNNNGVGAPGASGVRGCPEDHAKISFLYRWSPRSRRGAPRT